MSYQFEIECKCHIDKKKYNALIKTLRKDALSSHILKKNDIYYILETLSHTPSQKTKLHHHTHEIRLRDDNGIFFLTYKDKAIIDNVEQNKEYQSNVSDLNVIKMMLKLWGAKEYIRKQKKGFSFSVRFSQKDIKTISGITLPIDNLPFLPTIELIQVPPLGYFFEIEIICDKKTATTKCCSTLRSILTHIIQYYGIDISQIEKKPYTQMLLQPS